MFDLTLPTQTDENASQIFANRAAVCPGTLIMLSKLWVYYYWYQTNVMEYLFLMSSIIHIGLKT